MLLSRKSLVFLAVSAVTVALDQVTKWWVYAHIDEGYGEIEVIPGLFSLVHAQNPGAAIGLLRDFEYRMWVFYAFTVIAVGIIVDLWRRLPRRDWFHSATLGLILAGAVGNAIDRVAKQTVTDFLRVYTEIPSIKAWLIDTFGTYEWPTFNVADSALVVGVAVFLGHYLFLDDNAEGEDEWPEDDEASDQEPTDELAGSSP